MLIIETYTGKGSHPHRWRLKRRNGRIIADSAEGYATERSRDRAVVALEDELVKCSAVNVRPERKRKSRAKPVSGFHRSKRTTA